MSDEITLGVVLEKISSIKEDVGDIKALIAKQNSRVFTLEEKELTCGARMEGIPTRTTALERQAAEMRGAVKVAAWAAGGGGIMGIIAIIAQLLK